MALSVVEFDRARRDPAVFADLLVGKPLWSHQLEVVRSPARYRVICAGRRAGKSHLFGVLGLHHAFAVPGSKVLVVSAGEVAAKRLFSEIAGMASRSPMLRGSVPEESKSRLVTSQGSQVECVPASMAQVRSAEADLLIVDEAAFVPSEIWEAAEPTVIARPGSRVLLCSTPWSGGGSSHFFRSLWSQGMASPDQLVASWHWPSTVSPHVDEELLEQLRSRSSPGYFEREYLAIWSDEVGSFFTSEELDAAATVEVMVGPLEAEAAGLGGVVGGVDWGFRTDANALTVVAARPELDERGRRRFWVPYVREAYRTPYEDWVDELVTSTHTPLGTGFRFEVLVPELNGVGEMPSQVLGRRLAELGLSGVVQPAFTDARLKVDVFGWLRILLQQRRIDLPREPALLKQLRALEYEQLPGGGMRIAVPERAGHDDLAMSLCLALSAVMSNDYEPAPPERFVTSDDLLLDEVDVEVHYTSEGRPWSGLSPY